MPAIAIIPARYDSSRLPGKPLADIGGAPMIFRVWERCMLAGFHRVIIATDDQRIADVVRAFSGEAIMTSPTCRSGTERCAEVAGMLNLASGAASHEVIVNVQGDEPFLHPEHLSLLRGAFEDPEVNIATLAVPIKDNERLFNPNTPKVVIANNGNALYFSRHPLPYLRDMAPEDWLSHQRYLKHIGIYAYRTGTLLQLSALSPVDLEIAESLEQLRWLCHGYNIRVLEVEQDTLTVDTPQDLDAARDFFLSRQ